VFYACTDSPRTKNFGLGCITPWSTGSQPVPPGIDALQAPLSYDKTHPFAEVRYAPTENVHAANGELTVDNQSLLTLHRSMPDGYTLLNIAKRKPWMSVTPTSFSVGGRPTPWPNKALKPIAMVDTGGGPVLLSDFDGYFHNRKWPKPAACPPYPDPSLNCTCTSDTISITLADDVRSYSFTIDTAGFPPSVRGLTAMMCEKSFYMMGQYGMNIGGISALFNDILIDYRNAQVGFKPRKA
jgi:hypothetical protein